ncbi:MAG: phenylalanine--tRNA ligase beta subunit-related protein [Candidatus Bathyarchaeota archaeon]
MEVGSPDNDLIHTYLGESWNKLAGETETHGHSSHPLIAQWRKALQDAGVSVKKFPPSIQAIAKRTQRVEAPFSVNPIVDTYNAVCMDLVIPGGAYDVDQLRGGLKLRVSEGGEAFTSIGVCEKSSTLLGEIVYSDDAEVITRQFLWQQAERGKILDSTRNVVFVFELLSGMGQDIIENAYQTIETRFSTLLGGEIKDLCVHRPPHKWIKR